MMIGLKKLVGEMKIVPRITKSGNEEPEIHNNHLISSWQKNTGMMTVFFFD